MYDVNDHLWFHDKTILEAQIITYVEVKSGIEDSSCIIS